MSRILHIHRFEAFNRDRKRTLPSIIEVLDLLQERMERGLLLNIELKNGNVLYEGMEEKIINLPNQYGDSIKRQTIYSSFYTKSLERIRDLEPEASLGILDAKVSDCLYKNGDVLEMRQWDKKSCMVRKCG